MILWASLHKRKETTGASWYPKETKEGNAKTGVYITVYEGDWGKLGVMFQGHLLGGENFVL